MYRRVEISYNALLTKSIVIFGNLFDLIDDNNTESNEILVFNNYFQQLF
jgi:hypothetical protein